jgi:putative FmdB family regulatory protein
VPTYEYVCKECEQQLEVVQKFTDDALTTCPACSGPLRKIFGNVGISFKGSGFYKTDSRGGSSKPAAASSDATPSTSGGDSSSPKESSTKSDSPAPSSPAPSTTGSAAAS